MPFSDRLRLAEKICGIARVVLPLLGIGMVALGGFQGAPWLEAAGLLLWIAGSSAFEIRKRLDNGMIQADASPLGLAVILGILAPLWLLGRALTRSSLKEDLWWILGLLGGLVVVWLLQKAFLRWLSGPPIDPRPSAS